MEINSVGIVLSYYRDKYNFTLNQICEGICSASTLSRIESGTRCADSLTCSRLLERIGKDVCQFELLLNDEDYKLWLARESITESREKKEYGRVEKELGLYRRMKNNAQNLHEQFCLYQEIRMVAEELKSDAKIRGMILKALRLTKPAFEFNDSGKGQLYTSVEIELILLLVHLGEYQTDVCTEEVLLNLFRHVDYFYAGHRKQMLGWMILQELIELEQRLNNQDKLMSYIDKGIHFVAQGRVIEGLDQLHYLKAQALTRKYGTAAREDSSKKQEIQEECLMAYSICEVFGNKQRMKEIERFCREDLGWQITGLEM